MHTGEAHALLLVAPAPSEPERVGEQQRRDVVEREREQSAADHAPRARVRARAPQRRTRVTAGDRRERQEQHRAERLLAAADRENLQCLQGRAQDERQAHATRLRGHEHDPGAGQQVGDQPLLVRSDAPEREHAEREFGHGHGPRREPLRAPAREPREQQRRRRDDPRVPGHADADHDLGREARRKHDQRVPQARQRRSAQQREADAHERTRGDPGHDAHEVARTLGLRHAEEPGREQAAVDHGGERRPPALRQVRAHQHPRQRQGRGECEPVPRAREEEQRDRQREEGTEVDLRPALQCHREPEHERRGTRATLAQRQEERETAEEDELREVLRVTRLVREGREMQQREAEARERDPARADLPARRHAREQRGDRGAGDPDAERLPAHAVGRERRAEDAVQDPAVGEPARTVDGRDLVVDPVPVEQVPHEHEEVALVVVELEVREHPEPGVRHTGRGERERRERVEHVQPRRRARRRGGGAHPHHQAARVAVLQRLRQRPPAESATPRCRPGTALVERAGGPAPESGL